MGRLAMLIYCTQVCVLLTSLMELTVDGGSGCPVGRFGIGCLLQCHCKGSQDCGVGGLCPNNGACKSPYFGPGCQYVDLLITHGSPTTPSYLRDRNHSTCNPDPRARTLQLTFITPQPLKWFRIHASNHIALFHRNFTVGVDMHGNITVELFKLPGTDALDVKTFAPSYSGRNMTIEGPVVAYICTIIVSGGRNIALNQRAQQSTNYSSDPLHKVRAENAIDGNRNPNYQAGSCSHTEFETASYPYWNITFDRAYWFQRAIVYNSYVNMSWLSGFGLFTHDASGQLNGGYTDTSTQPLSVYTVLTEVTSPISAVTIIANRDAYPRVLVLCEVEIFGEVSCPSHRYGLQCEHQCQCNTSLICSIVAGACVYSPAVYCPSGTHGEVCELSCSENCQYRVCEALSGACRQCVPGYRWAFCDQVCQPGTFGPNCSRRCSENCAGPCDHATGFCSCKQAFTNDLCTECELGFSGEDCTRTCPRICPENMCDQITGDCLSCVGNRTGPQCEDCPAGYYGALCDVRCTAFCRDRSCDQVDGTCHGCVEGYRGEYCSIENENVYPSFWLLPVVVPFLLLMMCCFCLGGGNIHSEEE